MRPAIFKNVSSIYIHYPFCKRKCHYCDFPIHAIGKNKDNLSTLSDFSEKYIHYLLREIDFTLKETNPNKSFPLKSLYFGGGTPSLIPIPHLKMVIDKLKQYYTIDQNTEFSIECDPGTFDLQKLQDFSDFGVNRVSVGIQSTNDQTLKQLGRSHDIADVWTAIDTIKQRKTFQTLKNVSFDLIMGLPYEEAKDFDKSLTDLLSLQPGHLSIYLLALENNTVFTEKKKYTEGVYPLPKEETLKEMYCQTSQKLANHGYNHYEISTFSKNDQTRSVHNSNYWIGDSPFYGFGMGAASFFGDVRYTRPSNLKNYFKWVEDLEFSGIEQSVYGLGEKETYGSLDWLKSVVMGRTRTCDGFDLDIISKDQVQRELKYFVEPYLEMGYIEKDCLENQNRLKFTRPEGFLFSDEITSSLFLFFEENYPSLFKIEP